MSKQMTEDWIEQEYERWYKHIGIQKSEAKRSQYITNAFVLYILTKISKKKNE